MNYCFKFAWFMASKGKNSWGKGQPRSWFRNTGEDTKAGSCTKWQVAFSKISIDSSENGGIACFKPSLIFRFQVQLGFARLQAQVRSRQLHFQYKKRRQATLVLQTHVRGHLARKEWKRKRKAVILLQAHTRGILAKKALEKMKRDVSTTTTDVSSYFHCAAIYQLF